MNDNLAHGDHSPIAARLKQAREASGHRTRASAAERLGMARQTYAAMETGRRSIRPEWLARFAAAFGVSEAWLLSGSEDSAGIAPFVTRH